jgi:hypothetical protein
MEVSLLQNRASVASKPGEWMCGGALGLLNGVCGASIRHGGALALERERRWGKIYRGSSGGAFYRTRIPISCGGQTLSHRRIEFQLGSQIHLDLEIVFGLTMVEHGISSRLGQLLP